MAGFSRENFDGHCSEVFSLIDEALGIKPIANVGQTAVAGEIETHLTLDQCEKELSLLLGEQAPVHSVRQPLDSKAKYFGKWIGLAS